MRERGLYCWAVLAIAITLLVGSAMGAAEQSRDRLDYWRTKYQELKSTDDPRAGRAHAIFQRVVQVAGKRSGITPRLLIIASDPWDIALPIALPDGGIILSKGVLDISYQDTMRGDDRLAFVLAHELAHQLNDDFWHMRFFQALEASRSKTQVSSEFIDDMRQSAGTTEHVLARELQADERGIIYASMAGFNTQAIVAQNPKVNFFADWVRALDPRRIGSTATGQLRPTPEERAEALQAYLRRVVDKTALFQVGLWFYYAGDYSQAIRAFEDFRAFFPSREAHHNLAASHHQLALQAHQAWKKNFPALPFHLSLTIDPLTRASRIYLDGPRRGGAAEPAAAFRQHLDAAIALYREALTHDASYTPSAINLGCAFIVRGAQTEKRGLNADFSEAVTILLRALEHDPGSTAILNNLGVALVYGAQSEQAKDYLTRARTLAPAYAAPVFNLGQIAQAEEREAEARRYWQVYEQLALRPSVEPSTDTHGPESVAGLVVGQIEEGAPQSWERPVQSRFQLGRRVLTVATYPAGRMTLSQDGEIRMILVREGFRGASARGVMIGREAGDLLARYGAPTRRIELTQGHSWAYDVHRIAFQLRDGRIVSWLVF